MRLAAPVQHTSLSLPCCRNVDNLITLFNLNGMQCHIVLESLLSLSLFVISQSCAGAQNL